MGSMSLMHWAIVLAIVLVLFGAGKLPRVMGDFAKCIKAFKAGMKEGYVEQPIEGPCPFCQTDVPADSKFCPGCGKSSADIVAEKNRIAAEGKKSA